MTMKHFRKDFEISIGADHFYFVLYKAYHIDVKTLMTNGISSDSGNASNNNISTSLRLAHYSSTCNDK